MHVLYFECAGFKSDIGFSKFRAQIPQFEHFVQKSINFLILTKFPLYAISKCWFQTLHSLYVVLCSLVPKLHEWHFKIFENKSQIWNQKIDGFWPKMLKFVNLGSKFSKASVKFKTSTSRIGYLQNFVKIRKLILFGLKCPNFGIWDQNFRKQMTNLKSIHSK